MVKLIVSRNPQLKSPDYVEPNQNLLLPVSIIPMLEKDHKAAVVNYHFYF